jgi:hypothetical protein
MLCHLPFALFTRYFYSLSLCCLICKMGLIPTGVEGKSLNMLMHMQCLVQNDANYYSLHEINLLPLSVILIPLFVTLSSKF